MFTKQQRTWIQHWQNEVDAAFLYRKLSEQETNSKNREIFQRLADVEERHTEKWESIFREKNIPIPPRKPSRKARIQYHLAHRLGNRWLVPLLLYEEGSEVKQYLTLHRHSAPGTTKTTAYQLAHESVEHVSDLKKISESDGEPWHTIESGDLLRNIVYGFNDGLTANFGLVAGVVGGNVNHYIILLTGLAGTIADALSMGSSGYLAAKSQQEVYDHEIAMEKLEIAFMPEIEREELELIYQAKGIPAPIAQTIAREMMHDPERALQEKIQEELKINTSLGSPMRDALLTGTSTAIGALIPVAPFLMWEGAPAMWISFVLAMLAHFGVGAARSFFTGRGIFRSGMDMFIVGFGVAVVSYLCGDVFVRWLIGS